MATALLTASAGPALACVAAPQPKLAVAPLTLETARGRYDFMVEQAVTQNEKACGLMQRPRLARDEGMLFRRDPPGPAFFWMKNTPEPLDMLFIDEAGVVAHIAAHTTPYSTNVYGTEAKIAAVLELQAGMAARLSIRIGDRVRHAWFKGG